MRLCRMKPQRLSKDSFRTQYSGDARVALDGLPQGARGSFEGSFQNVVRVATAQTVDVQIELRRFRKRSPEVLCQLNRKIINLVAPRSHIITQIVPPP